MTAGASLKAMKHCSEISDRKWHCLMPIIHIKYFTGLSTGLLCQKSEKLRSGHSVTVPARQTDQQLHCICGACFQRHFITVIAFKTLLFLTSAKAKGKNDQLHTKKLRRKMTYENFNILLTVQYVETAFSHTTETTNHVATTVNCSRCCPRECHSDAGRLRSSYHHLTTFIKHRASVNAQLLSDTYQLSALTRLQWILLLAMQSNFY